MSLLSDLSDAIEELDYGEEEERLEQGDRDEQDDQGDQAAQQEEAKEEEQDDGCELEDDDEPTPPPSDKRSSRKTEKSVEKKHVAFATLQQDSGAQACMQLHVKVAQCSSFDAEDAREIVACRMALERVNLKKELQTNNDAISMLTKILDEREAVLKAAVDENMLETDSPLFTFFVKKQARLLDMLTALKQKKDAAE